MIDISNEDFGTLCICALRYCHGRRTYMPSLVQEIVATHFEDLSNKDLTIIANDERFQKDMEMWGDNCDKIDWQKFYKSLEQFIAEGKEGVMAELKPCPFCGRIPKVEDCGEHRYFVKCKCGVEQSRLYGQECDAVRHWNRRKPEPHIVGNHADVIIIDESQTEREI